MSGDLVTMNIQVELFNTELHIGLRRQAFRYDQHVEGFTAVAVDKYIERRQGGWDKALKRSTFRDELERDAAGKNMRMGIGWGHKESEKRVLS